jgi:hypothetical protein
MVNLKELGGSMEAKYANDETFLFKAKARRNKLIGLWAAPLMGMISPASAESYAKSVVMADFEEPGDGDVIRKLIANFAESGKEVTEKEMEIKLSEFMKQAIAELKAEAVGNSTEE